MKSALLNTMLLTAFFLLNGCGGRGGDAPPLAPVKGSVKFGGQPLADATIVFTPKGGGPFSTARTDASGNYELVFSRSEKGAKIGEHTVSITTYQSGSDDSEGVPEKIPTKYNTKSELNRTVENKDNVINFDLETGGEVVQPSKDS